MTPDDDDLTPDPQTAADDAADDAHTERWREERARGREHEVECPAHDPSECIDRGHFPSVDIEYNASCMYPCICDALRANAARVRADERDRAAGRVQSLYGPRTTPAADTPAPKLDAALAAIREGGA